jgi:hypothetical protein
VGPPGICEPFARFVVSNDEDMGVAREALTAAEEDLFREVQRIKFSNGTGIREARSERM